ncbi:MAG: hypothetical protein ABR599_01560 [Gemmatimonadota bacterium]
MNRMLLALAAALVVAACGERETEEAPAGQRDDRTVDVAQEAERVQVGMTEPQVVEILGEPRTRVKEPAGERLTFWTFDAADEVRARVYVSMDSAGRVANVETVPL